MFQISAGQAADELNSELSDLELLSAALTDALAAHESGELAAPWGVDELALRAAERRARCRDMSRSQRAEVLEVAA